MDPGRNFIAPEDNIFRINPCDESALDMALNLKDRDESVEVIILTLGPVIAERELRRCLAIGADGISRIDDESEHDSWSKSALLARGIEKLKADLVLCGRESVDSQNGQTGAFIAHHLHLPFVSLVTQILSCDKGMAMVIRNAGRGIREEIECSLPAVLSISQTGVAPRLSTYEQRQKAMKTPFKILDIQREDIKRKLFHEGLFPPRPRPKKVRTPDSSLDAFERTNLLLAGSSVKKKGVILDGSPESQADGIVSYLVENGFLEAKKE